MRMQWRENSNGETLCYETDHRQRLHFDCENEICTFNTENVVKFQNEKKKKKCMVYCSATKVMQNMSCKNAIISIQMNSFPLNVLFVYSKVYSDGAWCLPFKTLQWFRREFFELYIYRYLQFSQGLFSLFGTGREELRFKDISITPCS